jgi:hypothetical protein
MSPWGIIDNVEILSRGISFVSTPSHGGLRVAKAYGINNLSSAALAKAIFYGNNFFYEGDCDYAIPLFELSHLWDNDKIKFANVDSKESFEKKLLSTMLNWSGDYLLAVGYPGNVDNWRSMCIRINKDPQEAINYVRQRATFTETNNVYKYERLPYNYRQCPRFKDINWYIE